MGQKWREGEKEHNEIRCFLIPFTKEVMQELVSVSQKLNRIEGNFITFSGNVGPRKKMLTFRGTLILDLPKIKAKGQ